MENTCVYVLVFDDYENTCVDGVYSSVDKAIEKAGKERFEGDSSSFRSKEEVVGNLERDGYATLSAYFSIYRFEINDGEK